MQKETYTREEVNKLLSKTKTEIRKEVYSFIASDITSEEKRTQAAALNFMKDKSEYYQEIYDQSATAKKLLESLRAKMNIFIDKFDSTLGEGE